MLLGAFRPQTTTEDKKSQPPSVTGFPTSQLSPVPLMWFSSKRTTCCCSKPQLSTKESENTRPTAAQKAFTAASARRKRLLDIAKSLAMAIPITSTSTPIPNKINVGCIYRAVYSSDRSALSYSARPPTNELPGRPYCGPSSMGALPEGIEPLATVEITVDIRRSRQNDRTGKSGEADLSWRVVGGICSSADLSWKR
jgi:hypothetical protein